MSGTLPSQVLSHRLSNGASFADWLGTAASACRIANSHLTAIREDRVQDTEKTLKLAIGEIAKAMEECSVLQGFLEQRERELQRMFASDRQLVADMERDGLL